MEGGTCVSLGPGAECEEGSLHSIFNFFLVQRLYSADLVHSANGQAPDDGGELCRRLSSLSREG